MSNPNLSPSQFPQASAGKKAPYEPHGASNMTMIPASKRKAPRPEWNGYSNEPGTLPF